VSEAPPARTVLLAGATGLVGGLALRRLLEGRAFDHVVALTRRELAPRPRLTGRVVAFSDLDHVEPVPAAAALCALGTTIKAAGSQEAFRAVDHEAVVAFARWARRGGAPTFVLVSSVGADARARNFYLRVKGEAEESVAGLGFPRFVALRPSLLLGDRTEHRTGEAWARTLAPGFNPLLFGPFRRYRAIEADDVAAALIAAAADPAPARLVWEHDAIAAAAAAGIDARAPRV
jgi:uncharacterized protein YbjT (DUF2867 family)